MTMPRGTLGALETVPTATARWARLPEMGDLAYHGNGSIFLGAAACSHELATPTLTRLAELETSLRGMAELDAGGREARIAKISEHRARLSRTARFMVGVWDDRHLFTLAGSRAGKGTSAIIPTLLTYPGSTVSIDVKGELSTVTASRRGEGSKYCNGMGQKVAVLDPYRVSQADTAFQVSWNPFDAIDPDNPDMIEGVSLIIEPLILPSGGKDSAHFDETGRQLTEAVSCWMMLNCPEEDRNLLTVHRLLTQGAVREFELVREVWEGEPPNPLLYLFHLMATDDRLDGIMAGAANTMLAMGDNERGSVLSTVSRNLDFLKLPAMKRVVAESTIDLRALKNDPRGVSLYICLPPQRLKKCDRWLRLVISAAFEACTQSLEQPATGHPVLFVLDEMATLGRLEILELAAGYAAGFGMKLWCVFQDLGQIKRFYRDSWETFLGNAGTLQAFGNNDLTTTTYLSKLLGEIEVSQMVTNTTTAMTASTNDPSAFQAVGQFFSKPGFMIAPFLDQKGTGQSATTTAATNQTIVRTPLMQPDEIRREFRREAMNEIIAIAGRQPIVIDRINYFDDPELLGFYDPLPQYRDQAMPLEWGAEERERRRQEDAEQRTAIIAEAEAFIEHTVAEIRAVQARSAGAR